MKKEYIRPMLETLDLSCEEIMVLSFNPTLQTDTSIEDGGEVLANECDFNW